MRAEPARFSACDASGAEFDGGHGWHNTCGKIKEGNPCHVIPAEGFEEPYPIHSGDLEDSSSCGGCPSYFDSHWGGWLQIEEIEPDAPAPDDCTQCGCAGGSYHRVECSTRAAALDSVCGAGTAEILSVVRKLGG